MYGIVGCLTALPGQRDALADVLLNLPAMPGCLSYIVSLDAADPDRLWVTEVWVDQDHHVAALGLPSIQEALRVGKPLIAGMSVRTEVKPLGGHGLAGPSGDRPEM